MNFHFWPHFSTFILENTLKLIFWSFWKCEKCHEILKFHHFLWKKQHFELFTSDFRFFMKNRGLFSWICLVAHKYTEKRAFFCPLVDGSPCKNWIHTKKKTQKPFRYLWTDDESILKKHNIGKLFFFYIPGCSCNFEIV